MLLLLFSCVGFCFICMHNTKNGEMNTLILIISMAFIPYAFFLYARAISSGNSMVLAKYIP